MNLFGKVLSFIFPDFRIKPIPLKDVIEKLNQVSKEEKRLENRVNIEKEFIINVFTELWRLQRQLSKAKDGKLEPKDIKRITYYSEMLEDMLKDSEIEVRDWTGEKYHHGMIEKVLTYQPMPELDREIIIETVKPTIYYKGQIIQIGEVIVGRPLKEEEKEFFEK